MCLNVISDFPPPFSMESSENRNFYRKQLGDYLFKGKVLTTALDSIGWKVSGIAVSFFGKPSQYIPANNESWATHKGGNTPLVYEGYLRDAWSWKNSVTNAIQNFKTSGGI